MPLISRRTRNGLRQHVLMDRPNYLPYPSTEEERSYPEPDYVPAYPWLGEQEQARRPLSPTHPNRHNGPMLDEDVGPETSDSEVGKLGSVSNDAIDQRTLPRRHLRYGNDPAVDHDFELSEGSRMCV